MPTVEFIFLSITQQEALEVEEKIMEAQTQLAQLLWASWELATHL